jgi:hypothetical protein
MTKYIFKILYNVLFLKNLSTLNVFVYEMPVIFILTSLVSSLF